MKVLVTGGAGFIGSNLCTRLVGEGHDVYCVDNLYTGRKENLLGMTGKSNFHFIQHDVQQPIDLDVDQIYHLACPASPPHYQRDPVFTVKTSFLGTLNMLELAERRRIPILLASTSEVYGDPQIHPQVEAYWGNVNPIGVRSCYDEGKRVAETLAGDFRRSRGVDTRIIRIFNTYGPMMDPADGRVVSNFIVQALRGEPLTLYGDGAQTRSFCYVSDLVEGMVRVMGAEECPGPINLGNPSEFTVAELAHLVRELVGGESELVYKPLPQDDPTRRKPNIGKAKELLGWEPVIPLEGGLRKTIPYFAERLGMPWNQVRSVS